MPTLEVSKETYGKILRDLKIEKRGEEEEFRFRKAAGSWKDIDAESFKEKTFKTRERSSRKKVEL